MRLVRWLMAGAIGAAGVVAWYGGLLGATGTGAETASRGVTPPGSAGSAATAVARVGAAGPDAARLTSSTSGAVDPGAASPSSNAMGSDLARKGLPASMLAELLAMRPDRRAQLERLIQRGSVAAVDPSGTVPPPVNLRRESRRAGTAAPGDSVASLSSPAEIGLPVFPGAVAVAGSLKRSMDADGGVVTSAVLVAAAAPGAVRDFYRNQLPASLQGERVVVEFAVPGGWLDLRRYDLVAGSIQRVQVEVVADQVFLRLSSTRLP
jgi:hypothetical protein